MVELLVILIFGIGCTGLQVVRKNCWLHAQERNEDRLTASFLFSVSPVSGLHQWYKNLGATEKFQAPEW
jgi:hypothetical protein